MKRIPESKARVLQNLSRSPGVPLTFRDFPVVCTPSLLRSLSDAGLINVQITLTGKGRAALDEHMRAVAFSKRLARMVIGEAA